MTLKERLKETMQEKPDRITPFYQGGWSPVEGGRIQHVLGETGDGILYRGIQREELGKAVTTEWASKPYSTHRRVERQARESVKKFNKYMGRDR